MVHSRGEGFQWVVLTVLGLVAGLALALPLGVPIFAIFGAMVGTPVVLSIVGFGLGTAQWPIIRRHVASSGWWIVVSALGMGLGLTAGVILVEQAGRAVMGGPVNFRMLGVAARAASFATIGIMAGASLGLAQWLVLRRHAASCKSWISVNALSLAVGLASGSLLADVLVARSGSVASIGIMLAIGSTFAGACTANLLAKIFSPGRELSAAQRQLLHEGDSKPAHAKPVYAAPEFLSRSLSVTRPNRTCGSMSGNPTYQELALWAEKPLTANMR